MNATILYPPHIQQRIGFCIFLVGPIQGAPDWQQEAIRFLVKHGPSGANISIANPRRPKELLPPLVDGDLPPDEYNAQVDWEHHHLEHAARHGITLCWLARPERETPGRAYAQTSRFELGEAMAMHRLSRARLAVGVEEGFSNRRYIIRTFAKKAPSVPLCCSLEETCLAALEQLP